MLPIIPPGHATDAPPRQPTTAGITTIADPQF